MSLRALIILLVADLIIGSLYFFTSPFSGAVLVFREAAGTTLWITGMSALLAVVFAFPSALAKLSPWWPLRWFANAYIEVFRGTSALVQIFWIYFVLPQLGVELPSLMAGVLAISLNVGAYGAIVVEAAIRAVPQGQREAAISLNLTGFQSLRRIIIPQALVLMLPPWGNLMIQLFKMTSLVYVVGIAELTFTAYQLNQTTYQAIPVYAIIFFLYLAIGLSITIAMRLLEGQLTRGLTGGGHA
jgi:polar amino acid transport system permease protein